MLNNIENSIKNILFRADSSSIIGTGHIMRGLVLASKYKNANIIFAVQDLKGNINHKIIESDYTLHLLKSNSKKELLKLLKSLHLDILVIDSYDIDYKFEKFIKTNLDVEILCFDDTYEKHYCDILLNHNISGDKKRYKDIVPKDCELRCGAKYTLLRDEFIKEKKKSYKKSKKVKTIFLAMGGADHSYINIKILKVLKKLDNIAVHVVTTKANQNLQELERYVKTKEWVTLHVESNNIAKLMAKSDFAIVTPSVTLNEVSFMELPFIAIKTADNQKDMHEYVKKKGYMALWEFDSLILHDKIKDIMIKIDGGKF